MPDALIDVMIPTLNESAHIAETVANARQVGNVWVLDSLSTDGTQELAAKAGAVVVQHKFESYSRQKNWGLDNLPMNAPWVFILDADERLTPGLRDELLAKAKGTTDADGFFVNRLMLFMGQPIRHGGLYPSWNLRFFRRGKCRYEDRAVHEHMICDGPTDYLKQQMLHVRIETISQYVAKHIHYADLESEEWLKQKLGQGGAANPQDLFRDTLRVRQWLRRRVWPNLPGRPLWRFMYMYLLRMGFLDGRAGWDMAMLMASYEYMISLLYKDKLIRARAQAARNAP